MTVSFTGIIVATALGLAATLLIGRTYGIFIGLGFDTATEVTLIAITVTVGTAAVGSPL